MKLLLLLMLISSVMALKLSMMTRLPSIQQLMPVSMPICVKTTVTDDPLAGMTPDQISDYISNVGGGMCGYPEIVKTFLGLGLNLSLIVFGIFTVSYVVLGGLNFALEKQVEDSIKDIERQTGVKFGIDQPEGAQPGRRAAGTSTIIMPNSRTFVGGSLDEMDEADEMGVGTGVPRAPSAGNNRGISSSQRRNDGLNRNERRLKNKIKDVDPSK